MTFLILDQSEELSSSLRMWLHSHQGGADLAFPVGGGANPPEGANIRICQIFQKSA